MIAADVLVSVRPVVSGASTCETTAPIRAERGADQHRSADGRNADVAVAIGGGSAIDAVKAAGFLAHPLGQLPDRGVDRCAVQCAVGHLHRERGVRGVPVLPRNPDLVLVDSQR
jgi:glycerol dehydrogenase-like iron-containing ADH family enzyme